ncbi:MAG: hypothetical protein CMF99_05990 [Candidatus Marinimicrobia bacterium]|nr:hypothetical protein [Candidatus Neomarinimicrobiota bacterium]
MNKYEIKKFYLFLLFNVSILIGQNIIYTKTFPSGKPKIISYIVNKGVDKVRQEEYFGNGTLKKEGYYQFGNKQGKWKSYFSSGNLKKEENFNNDKLDGEMITWHQNGKKKEKGNFRNGKREGLFFSWKENGSLYSKKSFVNGLMCYFIEYSDSGSIVTVNNYCD